MNLTNLRAQFNLKVYNKTSSSIATTTIDAYLNEAYQTFQLLVLQAMGDWQINSNYAYRDIVAGQRDYAFDSGVLKVDKVFIKSVSTGEYLEAKRIDINDLHDEPLDNYRPSSPQYDFVGNNMFIFTPEATITDVTSGIKIFLTEEMTELANTSDIPAIPKALQPFLYTYAAREFLENDEKFNKAAVLMQKQQILENKITEFYSVRSRPIVLRPQEENFT